MRAAARVVAEADGRGGTRLPTLAGQAPLLVRRTGARTGPGAAVHLVGGAAGPLGGDELACSVEVRAGAALRVESAAASVALPGPAGGESCLDVTARIDAGGVLHWTPQPLIAARGARHRTTARVELAGTARLVWREEFVLGRFGEASGSVAARLRVLRRGRPLLDHELAVGPEHPGSLGPAVVGRRRAVGSVLIVDPAWEQVDGDARIAVLEHECADSGTASVALLPLAGPAVLVSAAAEDGLALERVLDRVLRRMIPSPSAAAGAPGLDATATVAANTDSVPSLAAAVRGGA